jgi:hypothetical protein
MSVKLDNLTNQDEPSLLGPRSRAVRYELKKNSLFLVAKKVMLYKYLILLIVLGFFVTINDAFAERESFYFCKIHSQHSGYLFTTCQSSSIDKYIEYRQSLLNRCAKMKENEVYCVFPHHIFICEFYTNEKACNKGYLTASQGELND